MESLKHDRVTTTRYCFTRSIILEGHLYMITMTRRYHIFPYRIVIG